MSFLLAQVERNEFLQDKHKTPYVAAAGSPFWIPRSPRFKWRCRQESGALIPLLGAVTLLASFASGLQGATGSTSSPGWGWQPSPPGVTTSISLQSSGATAYPGSLVALTATVTPSSATGLVTFYSGNTRLGAVALGPNSAAATLTTHFSSTGDYSLTASYGGDLSYAPSTSSSVSETVKSGSYSLDLASYTASTASGTYDSHSVSYKAYSDVVYAANPVDSTYESMNIFIPTSVDGTAVSHMPVLIENGVGGYMSSEAASSPGTNGTYAIGKGYVVVEVGCRGRDNGSSADYFGVAPAAMVDLKAAVRFLRYNASAGSFTGDVSHIISSGGSAGGALSSLLGASGNSSLYYSYLAAIGAADARDNIFAVGAWSPITNLDHADGAYEEEYSSLKYSGSAVDSTISSDLRSIFEKYQDELGLRDKRGALGPLTHNNITQYILEQYMEPSLAKYVEAGGSVPSYATCVKNGSGESCTFTFSDYVANSIGSRGKNAPAFDAFFDLTSSSAYYGKVVNTSCTPETLEFGDPTGTADSACSSSSGASSGGPPSGGTAPTGGGPSSGSGGSPRHFTNFSSETVDGTAISSSMQTVVNMMNPMYYIMNAIATGESCGVADYWYVRDGTIATDTSAYVIVDLATALENLRGTSRVNSWEDWGEGHNVEVDPSGFSTWVTDSVAAHKTGFPAHENWGHCDSGFERNPH